MRASAEVMPTNDSHAGILHLAKEFRQPEPRHLGTVPALVACDKDVEHKTHDALQNLCSSGGCAQCRTELGLEVLDQQEQHPSGRTGDFDLEEPTSAIMLFAHGDP